MHSLVLPRGGSVVLVEGKGTIMDIAYALAQLLMHLDITFGRL